MHVLFQHYEELKVSTHIQLICSYKTEIKIYTPLYNKYHGYPDETRTQLRQPIYTITWTLCRQVFHILSDILKMLLTSSAKWSYYVRNQKD